MKTTQETQVGKSNKNGALASKIVEIPRPQKPAVSENQRGEKSAAPSDAPSDARAETTPTVIHCDAWQGGLDAAALVRIMNAQRCNAGRIRRWATDKRLGRLLADAEGDLSFFADARNIRAYRDAGLFGDGPEVAKNERAFRAYHAVLTGLHDLGLIVRRVK